MNDTPALCGLGVRLLPLAPQHVAALASSHDADTWRWLSESGADLKEMAALVDRALQQAEAGTAQPWIVVLPDAAGVERVVGSSRIADWNRQHRTAELGWSWLAPELRGSGLNARVKWLQLRHCFHTLRLRRVALKTHHANLRSQRAMQGIGATFEGIFRNHMVMPDGTSRDSHWYSIIDADWPGVEAALLHRIGCRPSEQNTPAAAPPLAPLRCAPLPVH